MATVLNSLHSYQQLNYTMQFGVAALLSKIKQVSGKFGNG